MRPSMAQLAKKGGRQDEVNVIEPARTTAGRTITGDQKKAGMVSLVIESTTSARRGRRPGDVLRHIWSLAVEVVGRPACAWRPLID